MREQYKLFLNDFDRFPVMPPDETQEIVDSIRAGKDDETRNGLAWRLALALANFLNSLAESLNSAEPDELSSEDLMPWA